MVKVQGFRVLVRSGACRLRLLGCLWRFAATGVILLKSGGLYGTGHQKVSLQLVGFVVPSPNMGHIQL